MARIYVLIHESFGDDGARADWSAPSGVQSSRYSTRCRYAPARCRSGGVASAHGVWRPESLEARYPKPDRRRKLVAIDFTDRDRTELDDGSGESADVRDETIAACELHGLVKHPSTS
jgi:hypothetical protein